MPSNFLDKAKDKVEREKFRALYLRHALLKLSGITNYGNSTAFLVSDTNGYGEYNKQDHEFNLSAAYQLREELESKLLIGKETELFDSATSDDLREVILNEKFANIFVIGHASYHSWRASDRSLDWFDIGQMVDSHLKNGIFANVGCGGIRSWNMIPFGYFVVSDPNNLIGYEAKYSDSRHLGELKRLKKLRRMPSEEFIASCYK